MPKTLPHVFYQICIVTLVLVTFTVVLITKENTNMKIHTVEMNCKTKH